MSLITQCPACETMFRVVPDQLRIADGWVRCGHCGEVFDAAAAQVQPDIAHAPAPADSPPAVEMYAQSARDDAPTRATHARLETRTADEVSAAIEPLPPAAASVGEPVDSTRDEPRWAEVDEALSETESLGDLSFVRDAQRKAFWRRPLVRTALVLVLLVLATTLGGQYAVQERDRIAAVMPELRPYLERLCEPLDCRVAAFRSIDAITIESSGFNRLRPDTYRLGVSLKNTADIPVALPAIELTLTDTQDQPVLRRVLRPSELGPASGVLTASGEWNGSATLVVAGNINSGRIAGYRLLAFYP